MPSSMTTPNEPFGGVDAPSVPAPSRTRPEPPIADGSWGLLAVPMIICLCLMLYVMI